MLHMDQGIYAPLSQVMTDSDSEEEIHNSSKHQYQQQQRRPQQGNLPSALALHQQTEQLQRQRQRQLLQQQQEQFQRQRKFQLNLQTGNGSSPLPPSIYTTNMQNTFRSVMTAEHCDTGSTFSGSFNNDYDERSMDADNVAILGTGNGKEAAGEPMSTARLCCFIGSLLLCLLAVIGFVWLVPCNERSTCPAMVDRIKTHNWLNNYTKIELKGGVNVVNGQRDWENNLIFLYRGDAFFPEFKTASTRRNGIISLVGSSGAVAWYEEMTDEPVAIDCTLLDVDSNGRADCLVIDEYGELGALDPISGQWLWQFKERSAQKVGALDFPVMLPDLDGDGVLEVLLVTSASLEQRTKDFVQRGDTASVGERNVLRILSGRRGQSIGDGFKIRECDVLRKLQLENQMVTFNCLRNSTEVQRYKTLADLFTLITNRSLVGRKLKPASDIAQHRHYGQRKDIDAQRNIYSLSGRELVVENRGKCPDDCNVTLILCETRNGETNVLRNFTNTGMHGMVPAQWHFKGTEMSGFVMKFWKWNTIPSHVANKPASNVTAGNSSNGGVEVPKAIGSSKKSIKPGRTSNAKDNATKSTKHNFIQSNKTKKYRRNSNAVSTCADSPAGSNNDNFSAGNEFSAFDHLVQKRNTYTISADVRAARSVANATKQRGSLQLDNYKLQMITETEILVLFIGADTRIENTSQSNVVQFCLHDRKQLICQPELNNQENSMLIADLDQDGSQELVSYTSTFVQASDDPYDWRLVTYVRLLRLQSELPAFYTKEKRN